MNEVMSQLRRQELVCAVAAYIMHRGAGQRPERCYDAVFDTAPPLPAAPRAADDAIRAVLIDLVQSDAAARAIVHRALERRRMP